MKKRSPSSREAVAWLLVLFGLYYFSISFFLAKRSLANVSSCEEAGDLLEHTLGLDRSDVEALYQHNLLEAGNNGCWMRRRVDSLIIIVVDALRFDFALYNLPQSVGSRLHNSQSNHSKLFQFVADPPTVTVQRLKAITTGGLPTFADLSANFGGASVEDDSWVRLLDRIDPVKRGLAVARQGFVGDDTWIDLYAGSFEESFPYPSFNTRDLDTVDNGCIEKIPYLMSKLRGAGEVVEGDDEIEVMIVHFLGVDHVGHTYGPHNQYMDAKLKEMDNALSSLLTTLESSQSCHSTFIFGDHGMTEDGNHGGGTKEETNAALFVHSSPACGGSSSGSFDSLKDQTEDVQSLFTSIHQIDIVPTISFLLGLPIPYANLGSLVPSLLPGNSSLASTSLSLALNSAQVWRYFTEYSKRANPLPDMDALRNRLNVATTTFKKATNGLPDIQSDAFSDAAAEFKLFLFEALASGQRAWTRFDDVGMLLGIGIVFGGLSVYLTVLFELDKSSGSMSLRRREDIVALFLGVYQSVLVTFSNSYIYEEEQSALYVSTILCLLVTVRHSRASNAIARCSAVMLLPLAGRLHGFFIGGHGLDPAIRLHAAHSASLFIPSLLLLIYVRIGMAGASMTRSIVGLTLDCIAMVFLGLAWIEKRSLDEDRNGYTFAQVTFAILSLGIVWNVISQVMVAPSRNEATRASTMIDLLVKVAVFVMAVTGPAAGPSLVLYMAQIFGILLLVNISSDAVSSLVLAILLRCVTRHTFFATNHGCAFNRLQYSSAFIATEEFSFTFGGLSLFFNTFGWEMLGLSIAWLLSRKRGREMLWNFYCVFQILELLASCISVSLLRRHLFVWDIFAPHFLFVAIYTILFALWNISALVSSKAS